MSNNLMRLNEALFSAFANEEHTDSQSDNVLWAIQEGIARTDPMRLKFDSVKARKDHKCTRKCSIQDGSIYFHAYNGGAWGSEVKLCARCMAMILYYADVQSMPAKFATHWDWDKQDTVLIKQ